MRDEVDDLVEAWGRERGDLDLAPVAVFSRISRLARHLDLARRDAFTAHGIESWEFDVLAALRRAGEPYELSPGRLLRETLVTSGTMTNRVDRLTGRGLVERLPDPHDRRGVLVRLTAEGKAAVDAVGHRAAGHEGLAQQAAGGELVGLAGAPQRGQHVELPRLDAVRGEGVAAGEVEVARQPADPGEHLDGREVEVAAFASPGLDQVVHLVAHDDILPDGGFGRES